MLMQLGELGKSRDKDGGRKRRGGTYVGTCDAQFAIECVFVLF